MAMTARKATGDGRHLEVRHLEVRHLEVRGEFDLRQSVEFGFGQRDATRYDGTMTLAMCLDGYDEQAAVVVRPDGGRLACEVLGGDPEVAARQVARVLSVDVDSTEYDDLGRRDGLVGSLQRARPGLRPPLFHSAYEAACWAVLSARRPQRQGARLRERLSLVHGRSIDVAGVVVSAFPTPDALLEVSELPGLPAVALTRLHAIAEEARSGGLDTAALRTMSPADAAEVLRRLPGIGPFYAELVVVRALGHTDVLPRSEPRVRALAAELTGVAELNEGDFAELAGSWAPWRTWTAVAVRAAGPVLLDGRAVAR